jgi:Flp pilus assembly secretin CpaC
MDLFSTPCQLSGHRFDAPQVPLRSRQNPFSIATGLAAGALIVEGWRAADLARRRSCELAVDSVDRNRLSDVICTQFRCHPNALLSRALPGFNFLIGSENSPRVMLDALYNVTDVKVLSNPSLVVLDNQAATLQVGDQVPFSTGTVTVLTANNTVVNTIDYNNTGIILRVLPPRQRQW